MSRRHTRGMNETLMIVDALTKRDGPSVIDKINPKTRKKLEEYVLQGEEKLVVAEIKRMERREKVKKWKATAYIQEGT